MGHDERYAFQEKPLLNSVIRACKCGTIADNNVNLSVGALEVGKLQREPEVKLKRVQSHTALHCVRNCEEKEHAKRKG